VSGEGALRDRVVVVTGAAGGIGRAICHRVAQLGGRVVAVDADSAALAETASVAEEAGAAACLVHADVSQDVGVAAYVEAAITRFGRIDGLVSNAGTEGLITPTVEYPVEVFDRVIAINLRGVFLGLKHVLPVMIDQGAGVVVNVASVAGLIGHPGHSAYVASKHGVVGLTRVAAAEVGQHGVRVNAVCPGPTSTRMIASIEEQAGGGDAAAKHREIAAKIPAGRYGEPDEIARSVAFLLGDDASYVNGATLTVDGAFTAAI
jgi:NAD(P)-dependent dehydrogenase (short-subunit alcohol dehydrogenase family)